MRTSGSAGGPQRITHFSLPCSGKKCRVLLQKKGYLRGKSLLVSFRFSTRTTVCGLRGSNSLPGIPRIAFRNSQEPCLTSDRNALRAWVSVSSSFRLMKNQGIQIGCPDLLWSGLRGSNSLPPPWQGGALPDELSPRNKKYYSKTSPFCQAFFTFFSIVFSMSFKEPITAPVLLKMPPIPSEHPTAPQPPALLDTPEFLPPWA